MRVAEYRNGGYYIGKTGENDTMQVPFPVGRWLQEYPNCMIRLAYKRPDMHDFYPAQNLEIVNGNAVWTVKDTDVEVQGEGLAELQMVLGEKIEKSKTFKITIEQAAVMGDTPSDPVKDYFLRMIELEEHVIDVSEKVLGMTAEATTLPAGSQATASYDPATGIMTIGIPVGHDGLDGYSPAVTITDTETGHIIKITDKDHPSGQNFTVVDGIDGYSPVVTIEEIEGGHTVKITDKAHQSGQTFDVMDGNVPIDDTNPSTEKVYSSSKVSSEISTLDNDKVDKIEGKGLSANDFTDALKTKLDGIEENATHTIVDEELSDESTNPVQNKVVSEALDDINQTITPLPTEATGETLKYEEEMKSKYFDAFVEIVDDVIERLPKEDTMSRLVAAVFQNAGLLEDLYNGMNEESEVVF